MSAFDRRHLGAHPLSAAAMALAYRQLGKDASWQATAWAFVAIRAVLGAASTARVP